MNRWLFSAFAVVASVGVLSVVPVVLAQPQTPTDRVRAEGRTLYLAHCASCHGASGRGDGPVADSLRRRPSDLTQMAKQNGGAFPSAKASRIIDGRDVGAHGTVEMPVWGSVFKRTEGTEASAAARIAAIVRHLDSLQERAGQ